MIFHNWITFLDASSGGILDLSLNTIVFFFSLGFILQTTDPQALLVSFFQVCKLLLNNRKKNP